jgi:hypothetical protein
LLEAAKNEGFHTIDPTKEAPPEPAKETVEVTNE